MKSLSTKKFFLNLDPVHLTLKDTWLVKADTKDIFKDSYLPITSKVYSFDKVVDGMVIKEVYNIGKGMNTIHKQIGSWKSRKLCLDDSNLFERRKDFNGFEFEAVVLEDPPITTVYTEEGKLRIGGFIGTFWHGIMEKHMNFSTKIRLVPDGKYGTRDESGTWNGMVQEVYSMRSDIALSDFAITKQRSEVVDFSPPILESDIGLFIKYPERESSWLTFIRPFDHNLWFSLGGLLFVFAFVLSLTYYLGYEKTVNPDSFTFSYNIFLPLVAQMGQGSVLEPKSVSSKMVFLTIFLFSIIIITSFSAKMISFLAFVKIDPEIETLEDVIASDFKICTVEGTTEADLFKKAQDGTIFKQVYDEKILENQGSLVETVDQALKKIINEKFVFFYSKASVINRINDKCEILSLAGAEGSWYLAYIWGKNLPHGQFFSYFTNTLGEEGVLNKLEQKYVAKPRSDCAATTEFVSMGFSNIISAFAMLFTAGMAAVAVCVLELFVNKWKKRSSVPIKYSS